jgi:hypothetical protein
MTIADMASLGTRYYTFGFRTGTRDNYIISGKIHRLECIGAQEWNKLRVMANHRNLLNETRRDPSIKLRKIFWVKGRAEYVRLRYHLEHIVEHLFSATPVFEPVANDSYPKLFYIHITNIFREKDALSILALLKSKKVFSMNTHNSSGKTHKQRKAVLVHDSFFIKGGAERMNIEIAKILEADMYSAVFRKESYDLEAMGFRGKKVEIFPSFQRGVL